MNALTQDWASHVLARIADGLGIPRGYMGLAYDSQTTRVGTREQTSPRDEQVERRTFLAHAAAVAVGAATIDISRWLEPAPSANTPVPDRIDRHDVDQIKASTTALADLHSLAGWSAFDLGQYPAARHHLTLALELAKQVEDPCLVAAVFYRAGRLHLHRHWVDDALSLFQLGRIAARDSGNDLTIAVLCANEAMAYLEASAGMVHTALDTFNPTERRYRLAVHALGQGLARRSADMTRSRAFELSALAMLHMRHGDLELAGRLGDEAATLACVVRSARVIDRLAPLQRAAVHRGATELAHRIRALKAA